MGFQPGMEADTFCVCYHPETMIVVGIQTHEGTEGSFDETRLGLDHVSFAVRDVADLHRWADRLATHSVEYSPLQESEVGHHLNLRDPDGIPIELFVLNPEAEAAVLGQSPHG